MPNKEQERDVIFVLDYKNSIYLGYPFQMSMLPVKVVKYKNIYVKQIKTDGYCPSNTVCRETMIAYVIAQLSENSHKRTIDMLIIISKEQRDNLNKGIKLVNHYEKFLNWNKTCSYDVDKVSKIRKTEKIYSNIKEFSFVIVTIPNKWLYSPQLLSLYLMFLKIAEIGFKCEFKTHKELMSQLDIFFAKKQTCLNGFMSIFYSRIQSSYEYWDMFLHNLDTLFKGKTRKFNYNIDGHLEKLYGNDVACKMHLDGIDNLINGHACDKQLKKNFSILKKTVKK